MVNWKNIRTTAAFVIIFLSWQSSSPAANAEKWRAYTSTTEVRYIDYFDDSLQVVTSGGWLKIDPATLGMRKLTNVDGLGTGDLFDIYKDTDGVIWLAGFGRLIKSSNGSLASFLFRDRNDNLMTLYSIEDDGNMIWVGTSSGLALFSKDIDGGQIEDFYFRFGLLNPEPAVYDISITGDSIWLATSSGLAVADKSDPDLLKSYINWTTFGSSDFVELEGDTVTALANLNGSIYMGTVKKALRLDISEYDTSFSQISTREPIKVSKLAIEGDTLAIYGNNGFYLLTGAGTVWSSTPTIPDMRFLTGRFVNGVHWVGLQTVGLYYGSESSYLKFDDAGLPGNYITALGAGQSGMIAGGFQRRGAAIFESDKWTTTGIIQAVPEGVREGVRAIAIDNMNRIWVGTWGNGLMLKDEETIINFDESNSSLRGIPVNPAYVVVNGVAVTPRYLFMTNYAAIDGRSVSVVDLEDHTRWRTFDRGDSLTSDNPVSIDFYDGTFAVATQYTGVFLYYCGSDPFVETGALAVNLRDDNSNLGSNTVNVVKYDNHGVLWAGTKYGLLRYDEGIPRFDDIILPAGFGPAVTALAFDGRDNAWIGSFSGLAFYNSVTGEFAVYTTLNSGLPDNHVISLVIDPVSGDLWIGTPSGIARLESMIGTPTRDVTQIMAFPNPFIIRDGTERLSFNYNGTATVRIYSSNSEIVRKMAINIPWDGKNQSGSEVASGVYLVLVTDENGSVGRSKIMLIRDR